MKNLKTKTEVVSSAETSKPVEVKPTVVQDTSIAVQEKPVQETVPVDAPKDEFVGIADLIKDIPDSKVEMAEGLGIPIRGILTWAAVIEANVKMQGKALQQLGVNLQPVVELAQKVKASQGAPAQATSQKGGDVVNLILEALRGGGILGGQAGMSQGDMYFMEMGKEMASLGQFMTKEIFKKALPEAFTKWESAAAQK